MATPTPLREARYRKSSYSGAQSSCVMIGSAVVAGQLRIGVQDSKTYGQPVDARDTLGFTSTAFAAFVTGVKNDKFNLA